MFSFPFNGSFYFFGSWSQIWIRFELVNIHQSGICFEFVDINEYYNIVGETILYFIQAKPLFLQLSGVFLSTHWEPKNYVPQCFYFMVLLRL